MPKLERLLLPACLAAVMSAPQPASATCEPEGCEASERWEYMALVSPVIATDGVLVFDALRGPDAWVLHDGVAFQVISAEVTADGQPITGSFEVTVGWSGLVWRPDAPLPPGATVSMMMMIDNESLWPVASCPDTVLDLGPFVAEVSDGPMPVLDPAAVTLTVQSQYRVDPRPTLDTMVCCDGAYPFHSNGSCDTDPDWGTGYCASTRGWGTLSSTWTVDRSGLAPELANNVVWRVLIDGQPHQSRPQLDSVSTEYDRTFCGSVELRSLASGEVMQLDVQCPADEYADMLGELGIDPSDALAQNCQGQPYVCEVIGTGSNGEWDENACMPYAGGDGETGDPGANDGGDGQGCSVGGQAPATWTLGLLAVLGLVRRRR